MSDAVETAIKQVSNILAQKDVISLELEGVCDQQGVFEQKMINPPKLNPNVSHKISLYSFQGCSFFPNLTKKNNKFYYNNGSENREVTFDTGAYDIKDYYEDLVTYMTMVGDDPKNLVIELVKATGKCRIILSNDYKVYFNKTKTWRNALGFDAVDLTTNGIHKSVRIVEVKDIHKVHAKCNLCTGTIYNGTASNILFSFENDKRYGSEFTIKPNNLNHKKLVNTTIDKVRVEFVDEDENPVDFLGNTIFMTIQIEQF